MRVEYYNDPLGDTCERCGQHINNIFVLTFADGFQTRVGSECLHKFMRGTNISDVGAKYLQKQVKRLKEARDTLSEWESYESLSDYVEELNAPPQVVSNDGTGWHYMTEEEFHAEKEWRVRYYQNEIVEIQQETAKKLARVRMRKTA